MATQTGAEPNLLGRQHQGYDELGPEEIKADVDMSGLRQDADKGDMPPPVEAFTKDSELPAPEVDHANSGSLERTLTAVEHIKIGEDGLADDNPFDDEDVTYNYQFAEWLEKDRMYTKNCSTLPLTFCTWLVFLFVIYFRCNIEATYRLRECLKGAIEEIQVNHNVAGFGDARKKPLRFHDIAAVDEMWSWIGGGLVPAMYSSPLKPAFVRTFNQVIGEVQLVQMRLKTGDCNVGKDLKAYYRQTCYGSGDELSTASFGVEAVAEIDESFQPATDLGDGKRFYAWLDVRQPALGQARANELFQNNWVTDATSSMEALVTFYNAEVETYAHISLLFSLERNGLIRRDLDVRVLWAAEDWEWYAWIFEILWYMCILKLFSNSLQIVVDNKKGARYFASRCCVDFWVFLDWLSIVVALYLIVMGFMTGFDDLASAVGKLHNPPNLTWNATVLEQKAYVVDYKKFHKDIAKGIDEIEDNLMWKMINRLCMYGYVMIFLLRFFRGFRGQPRIIMITDTIASASQDLLHFAIIFLVVFVNFAIAGHVLFGSEVPEWSTIRKALFSALTLAYGRVNWEPMYEVAPISAVIWLFAYAVAMIVLLLNMLLGIIADHFGTIYHQNNEGYGILGQSRIYLQESWWTYSYIARWIYRILHDMFPARVKDFKFTPEPKDEPVRFPIPYANVREACDIVPDNETTREFLLDCGMDESTADHLLQKCDAEMRKRVPEVYSLEKLFDEFNDSMLAYYYNMDAFSNDLRSFFAEKSKDAWKMWPRQENLWDLATTIQEAQISHQKLAPIPDDEGANPQLKDNLDLHPALLEKLQMAN
jgi:hypothetical protein